MSRDNTSEGTRGLGQKIRDYLSKIRTLLLNNLFSNRCKVWYIAIIFMSLTVISTFGYYDLAPTVLFDPPDGNYINTTVVTSNQNSTSEIVQKGIYRNSSANNSNISVYPLENNAISLASLKHFVALIWVFIPLAVASDRLFRCKKCRALWSLAVPALFFGWLLIMERRFNFGVTIEGSLDDLTLLSGLGMVLLLSFLFLIAYSAQGNPNPFAEKKVDETAVNLYTSKLSRTAQGVLSVGLAITIGGVISYGIGGSASPRVIPIIFLSGMILMPTLGIVTILHLKLHWVEQNYRKRKLPERGKRPRIKNRRNQ